MKGRDITPVQKRDIRKRYAAGEMPMHIAARHSITANSVHAVIRRAGQDERIDPEPLREARAHTADLRDAAARRNISDSDIARRANWFRPDDRRVTKLLKQKTVSYEDAVLLCRAIGVDPVDVGL